MVTFGAFTVYTIIVIIIPRRQCLKPPNIHHLISLSPLLQLPPIPTLEHLGGHPSENLPHQVHLVLRLIEFSLYRQGNKLGRVLTRHFPRGATWV